MDIFKLYRDFWDYCFENPEVIKPTHIAIYSFAIEHCNRLGWKKKYGLPTTMAMEAIGVKSYNTYIKSLRDLVDWGFIEMIEKSKNQHSSNIIALSKFNKALDKALDKATIKHTSKQRQSTSESNSSINKPIYKETKLPINNIEDRKKNLLFEPFGISFETEWKKWIDFKKTQFNFLYKTIDSEQTAFNALVNISKSNSETAVQIINNSIMNGYKGLFELKPTFHNQNQNGTERAKSKAEQLNDDFERVARECGIIPTDTPTHDRHDTGDEFTDHAEL